MMCSTGLFYSGKAVIDDYKKDQSEFNMQILQRHYHFTFDLQFIWIHSAFAFIQSDIFPREFIQQYSYNSMPLLIF